MIYFLRLPGSGDIKIGTTANYPTRMKAHAKKGSTVILGVHDGGRDVERAVHRKFDHLRVKNDGNGRHPEHFRPEPELLDYIAANCREPDLFDQVPEGGAVKAITVHLPRAAHRQLRIMAAHRDTPMSLLARHLILDGLKRFREEVKAYLASADTTEERGDD